ncbi:MAG: LysM domain/BON superfamily protein [Microgenomates bacterium OLB23]|nr:MAG: LysM domain/BON superfamily protein [Microgenomates bacterium OLB23]
MTTPRTITPKKTTNNKTLCKSYIVKKGDSYWSIAQKQLGNGLEFTAIMKANNAISEKLSPGQKIKLGVGC